MAHPLIKPEMCQNSFSNTDASVLCSEINGMRIYLKEVQNTLKNITKSAEWKECQLELQDILIEFHGSCIIEYMKKKSKYFIFCDNEYWLEIERNFTELFKPVSSCKYQKKGEVILKINQLVSTLSDFQDELVKNET